ncbi:MAG: trigger factor [Syntrophomonadaceae bacterium]|nr:trigger factor [Syntrophomonadaceae bacterium]
MEARLEKIEHSEAYIAVEVDPEQLEEGLQKAYLKVVKEVSLPGFRKGRVPRQLLEARFGPEILYQDAIEYIVPGAYEEAIKQLNIKPIAQPTFDIDEIKSGEAFTFKARIPIKPEVVLGDLEGIEIEIPSFEVTDEDVENRIKDMQARYAQLVVKAEDESAAIGDTVYHDFEGFIDGVPFAGGKGENYALELGSNTFIPGYEDQLVGVKTGEERDITVNFPEDYQSQELAGKEAVFKTKVNKIETKRIRDLDDSFVQEVSEFDTVEELRENVRKNLVEQNEARKRNLMRQEVLSEALKRCEIPVAEAVIREHADMMLRQFEYRLNTQGMDLDRYLELTGNNIDRIREALYPEAETKVKCDFLLEKLVEEKGIEVSDEEINKHIEDVANNTGLPIEAAKEQLEEIIESVTMQLKVDKAIDYLIDKAIVREKAPVTEAPAEDSADGETEQ